MNFFKGVHHVAMVTGDIDKTLRFWRDLLKLRVIGAFGNQHYKQYFFELGKNSSIAFFYWEGAEPVHEKDPGRVQKGSIIFDHIALEVTSEEELWRLKDRLEHNGEWVSEVIDHGIIYSLYTFDPNGIALEFTYQKERQSLQEHPLNNDKSPTQVALEGMQPQATVYPDPPTPTPVSERKTYKGLINDYMK